MDKKLDFNELTLGVCYYPEHWDKSLWRDDLDKMKQLGIKVVRIAEFAWNKFEPYDGEFDFSFFDEFMDITVEKDMKVIFCTPTATPPAWLSEKYPEILNADLDGNKVYHGLRRHCNFNSEKYRFYTARIVEKIAAHYGKYKNIIAWQLDNEINCECDLYRSESDHKAFREFLKNKFQTTDNLNKAIGAEFWNQTYTSWEEVYLPRRTNAYDMTNPHMQLLEKHFVSDTVIGYFKLQADIIRKYSSAFITTNGLFNHIDYHKLVGDVLDFITYDNYPNFAYEKNLDISKQNGLKDRNSSYNLMRARSISPIFGIMEQQSGPSGWNFRMAQPAPKPGQVRLWTLQAIAHGADFVSFFRWRTCTFGTEIYWHGIYNYDNCDNRRVSEVKKIYEDVCKLQGVYGKEFYAEAAMLQDYDNSWDGEADLWHGELDRISYDGWFRAFEKNHIPCDLVNIKDTTTLDELKKYKLLVYPHPTILTKERAELLKQYAQNGGTVIMGARTGYKDLNGICYMMPMPCYAAELCGTEVEEFTFLSPYDEMQTVTINENKVTAPCFNDVLRITDGKEVAVFDNNYYSGKTALSVKEHGKGKIYYFGAAFSEDTANALLSLTDVSVPLNIDKYMEIPESVELAVRGNYAFLINYDDEVKSVKCTKDFKDVLTEKTYSGEIVIEPYGVSVVEY